jgi:hypothetical protein
LAKLKEAEKEKEEKERLAYINPELADAARNEGNVAFKVRLSFALSVCHYEGSWKELLTLPHYFLSTLFSCRSFEPLPRFLCHSLPSHPSPFTPPHRLPRPPSPSLTSHLSSRYNFPFFFLLSGR